MTKTEQNSGEEMEVHCFKVTTLYIKWYSII